MKKFFLFATIVFSFIALNTYPQENIVKSLLQNTSLKVFIDTYEANDFNTKDDTVSTIRKFSSNSAYSTDFRLNFLRIEAFINTKDIRAELGIQYGDVPLLQTPVDKQFLKYLRRANMGVRLFGNTWLDAGYFLNPIGWESSNPSQNYVSSVSVGGYFQPGSIMGIRLKHPFSDKFKSQFYFVNTYAKVPGSPIQNKSLGLVFEYYPSSKISFINSTGFHNSKFGFNLQKLQVYNNLIFEYHNTEVFDLAAQWDFLMVENSKRQNPDLTAYMNSGMATCRYWLSKKLNIGGRVEFYSDPDAILSNGDGGSGDHLTTYGGAVGLTFEPYTYTYFKLEYGYLKADQNLLPGNNNFRHSIIFNAGLAIF